MEEIIGNHFIKHLNDCKFYFPTVGMKYCGFHIDCIRPVVPHILRFKNAGVNEITKYLLYAWQNCKEKDGSSDKLVWVIKCLHSPCGFPALENLSQHWDFKQFKRHVSECHQDIGRLVRKFCPNCGMVKGDGIEINRHTPVCPQVGGVYDLIRWSKIAFPGKTVICKALTEHKIYDPTELLPYQDKIKKSDKQVLLSFNEKIPSWWNTKTNKRHYTSLCLVCKITFVALDYNLHHCVLWKQVAEIDVDRPASR